MKHVRVWYLVLGLMGLGAGRAVAAGPFSYYPVQPCRIVDTRSGLGGFTGQLQNGVVRNFTIKGAQPCIIPTTAAAVSFNVTVADAASSGWVALWPSTSSYPGISTLNFNTAENIANGAVVPLASGTPDLSVVAAFSGSSGVNLILDITGYFK